MTSLVLAVALVLQQQATQRPAAASDSLQAATRQAITDVGRGVAEMRSTHELLRRAVFNSSNAQVLDQAHAMQQRCRELVTIARSAGGRVCRSCFAGAVQRTIDAYRAGLPAVGQVGTRCVNQLAQQLRARDPAAAVRAGIHAIGSTVTTGLFPYEAKLLDVRRAFGLVAPSPNRPPRRP
jgi:hypothetical protein